MAGINLKGDGIEVIVLMWFAIEARERDGSRNNDKIHSHWLRAWGATYSRGAASD